MNNKITEALTPLEVPQNLPFLKAICWQITDIKRLTPEEMLGQYEDCWHYEGVLAEPTKEELRFIKQLIDRYGSWLASKVQQQIVSF